MGSYRFIGSNFQVNEEFGGPYSFPLEIQCTDQSKIRYGSKERNFQTIIMPKYQSAFSSISVGTIKSFKSLNAKRSRNKTIYLLSMRLVLFYSCKKLNNIDIKNTLIVAFLYRNMWLYFRKKSDWNLKL